tara:strand:- start:592 stop:795 length:204 start_codon:yes stop_codon:yes gene_type:complete
MTKLTKPIDFLEKRYLRAWRLEDMIRIAGLMKIEIGKLSLLDDTREVSRAEFLLKRMELELQEFKAR